MNGERNCAEDTLDDKIVSTMQLRFLAGTNKETIHVVSKKSEQNPMPCQKESLNVGEKMFEKDSDLGMPQNE